MPGSGRRPKARVSVKLPIGVALRLSLACRLNPSEPNQAGTAGPTLRQPPPTFRHAWRTPSVLDVDGAIAVITCSAFPVRNGSGSGDPGRCPVGELDGCTDGDGADDVPLGDEVTMGGGDSVGESGVLVHPPATRPRTTLTIKFRRFAPTPPPCHAVIHRG